MQGLPALSVLFTQPHQIRFLQMRDAVRAGPLHCWRSHSASRRSLELRQQMRSSGLGCCRRDRCVTNGSSVLTNVFLPMHAYALTPLRRKEGLQIAVLVLSLRVGHPFTGTCGDLLRISRHCLVWFRVQAALPSAREARICLVTAPCRMHSRARAGHSWRAARSFRAFRQRACTLCLLAHYSRSSDRQAPRPVGLFRRAGHDRTSRRVRPCCAANQPVRQAAHSLPHGARPCRRTMSSAGLPACQATRRRAPLLPFMNASSAPTRSRASFPPARLRLRRRARSPSSVSFPLRTRVSCPGLASSEALRTQARKITAWWAGRWASSARDTSTQAHPSRQTASMICKGLSSGQCPACSHSRRWAAQAAAAARSARWPPGHSREGTQGARQAARLSSSRRGPLPQPPPPPPPPQPLPCCPCRCLPGSWRRLPAGPARRHSLRSQSSPCLRQWRSPPATCAERSGGAKPARFTAHPGACGSHALSPLHRLPCRAEAVAEAEGRAVCYLATAAGRATAASATAAYPASITTGASPATSPSSSAFSASFAAARNSIRTYKRMPTLCADPEHPPAQTHPLLVKTTVPFSPLPPHAPAAASSPTASASGTSAGSTGSW